MLIFFCLTQSYPKGSGVLQMSVCKDFNLILVCIFIYIFSTLHSILASDSLSQSVSFFNLFSDTSLSVSILGQCPFLEVLVEVISPPLLSLNREVASTKRLFLCSSAVMVKNKFPSLSLPSYLHPFNTMHLIPILLYVLCCLQSAQVWLSMLRLQCCLFLHKSSFLVPIFSGIAAFVLLHSKTITPNHCWAQCETVFAWCPRLLPPQHPLCLPPPRVSHCLRVSEGCSKLSLWDGV